MSIQGKLSRSIALAAIVGVAGLAVSTVPGAIWSVALAQAPAADIEYLQDELHGGEAYAQLMRRTATDLAGKESAGLSSGDGQAVFRAANTSDVAPRDPHFIAPSSAPVSRAPPSGEGAGAYTNPVTCGVSVPPSQLNSCDGIVWARFVHEQAHKASCNARRRGGIDTEGEYMATPGSAWAQEEAGAYEASNAILRRVVEEVLEESDLRISTRVAASAMRPDSHQDSNAAVVLSAQNKGIDGRVEFMSLATTLTHFTALKHFDCSASPLDQELTYSVNTSDMLNFNFIYQTGAPARTRYTCRRGATVMQDVVGIFSPRWSQPIRRERPFPYAALGGIFFGGPMMAGGASVDLSAIIGGAGLPLGLGAILGQPVPPSPLEQGEGMKMMSLTRANTLGAMDTKIRLTCPASP